MSNLGCRQDPKRSIRKEKRQTEKKHLEDKLDEALDETFPASDPIELSDEPD